MTEEEKKMAEEYVDTLLDKDDTELDKFLDEYLGDLRLTKKQAGAILGIIKGVGIGSYLAGLEEGRPKWHKVADGDLPKNNTRVLVLLKNKQIRISIFMENKFTFWNKDHNTYTKLYDVIAWCEIPQYTDKE